VMIERRGRPPSSVVRRTTAGTGVVCLDKNIFWIFDDKTTKTLPHATASQASYSQLYYYQPVQKVMVASVCKSAFTAQPAKMERSNESKKPASARAFVLVALATIFVLIQMAPASFLSSISLALLEANTTKYSLPEVPQSRQNLCQNITSMSQAKKGFGEWIQLCNGQFLKSFDEQLLGRTPNNQKKKNSGVHIVQIGAHIGFEPNDPIAAGMAFYLEQLSHDERARVHWTFVEPSPANYKQLTGNIASYNHLCDMQSVNAGVISDNLETSATGMVFYSIRDTIDPKTGFDSLSGKKLPYWITQVSSFSKKAIMFHEGVFRRNGLNVNDYIVETNVTTVKYSELMESIVAGNSNNVDQQKPPLLVLIDTEGFDCDIILGMSPQSPFLPEYLVFENHLCGKNKLQETNSFLERLGYRVKKIHGGSQNSVAIKAKHFGFERK